MAVRYLRPSEMSYAVGITAPLAGDPNLTSTAKLVYGRMAAVSRKTGEAYPSQEYLADFFGMSIQSIRKAIENLVDQGWIEVIRPTGRDLLMHKHNKYAFIFHPRMNRLISEKAPPYQDDNSDMEKDKDELNADYYPGSSRENTKLPDYYPGSSRGCHQGSSREPHPGSSPNKEESKKKKTMSPAQKGTGTVRDDYKSLDTRFFERRAVQLVEVVTSVRKTKVRENTVSQWGRSLRKLHTEKGISKDRIQTAMDWYCVQLPQTYGDPYALQIFSGESFYQKFDSLETKIHKEAKQKEKSENSEDAETDNDMSSVPVPIGKEITDPVKRAAAEAQLAAERKAEGLDD